MFNNGINFATSRHVDVQVLWIAVLTESCNLHLRTKTTAWLSNTVLTNFELASLERFACLSKNERLKKLTSSHKSRFYSLLSDVSYNLYSVKIIQVKYQIGKLLRYSSFAWLLLKICSTCFDELPSFRRHLVLDVSKVLLRI